MVHLMYEDMTGDRGGNGEVGGDAEPTLFTGNASLTKGNHKRTLSFSSYLSPSLSAQCRLCRTFSSVRFPLSPSPLSSSFAHGSLETPTVFLFLRHLLSVFSLSFQNTQTRIYVPAAEKDHKGTQREKRKEKKTTKGEAVPSHPFLQPSTIVFFSVFPTQFRPATHKRTPLMRATTAHTGDLKPPQSRWSRALPTPCQRRRGSAQIWLRRRRPRHVAPPSPKQSFQQNRHPHMSHAYSLCTRPP